MTSRSSIQIRNEKTYTWEDLQHSPTTFQSVGVNSSIWQQDSRLKRHSGVKKVLSCKTDGSEASKYSSTEFMFGMRESTELMVMSWIERD